ncbi:hypothetical protein UFOVP158_33 [uncultured Caudovirales phage]|uniref:Uncharacterized protein n=1 Tax=uncultured Caudovirales phage TaxID=2100421 RepID=A0A6J7WA91_9CAUD|nr:hypothetical protein UFOVP158_33 [uncultured Caudovirales phage]
MKPCRNCGSHAINPGHNERPTGVNEHLCDVCYWKNYADDSYIEGHNEGYNEGYKDGLDAVDQWSNHDY